MFTSAACGAGRACQHLGCRTILAPMKNLPIRPALVTLFALCAMVSLGLLACGSNDVAGDGPALLGNGEAAVSASADGQVSAALPAEPTSH
jgi:hypothetical protein